MENPNKENQGDSGDNAGKKGNDTQVSAEEFKKLQEQIENLNKGIATYRNEAAGFKKELSETKDLNAKLKKQIEEAAGDEYKISNEDEERLKSWARKQGFVTAQELEQKQNELIANNAKIYESQAIDEFVQKHPEYEDDKEWDKVVEEFKLYRQPNTLSGYRKLLDKIYKDLSENSSKEDVKVRAQAELKAKGRLSLGGGSQKRSQTGHESDIQKLQEQYPNLSREQIEYRIKEIDSLIPEEDKK